MTGKTTLPTGMSGCLATRVTVAIPPVADAVEAAVSRNKKSSSHHSPLENIA